MTEQPQEGTSKNNKKKEKRTMPWDNRQQTTWTSKGLWIWTMHKTRKKEIPVLWIFCLIRYMLLILSFLSLQQLTWILIAFGNGRCNRKIIFFWQEWLRMFRTCLCISIIEWVCCWIGSDWFRSDRFWFWSTTTWILISPQISFRICTGAYKEIIPI